MTRVFVQIRCRPGTAYSVANRIADREIYAQLYSTSGRFDLLLMLQVPDEEDVGRYIHDHLLDIDGIERTETILTYNAFWPIGHDGMAKVKTPKPADRES